MVGVLVAGGPGSGKSAVSNAVRARGLCAVDLDYGYARHENATGNPVQFPEAPDLAWLHAHHWQWLDDRLSGVLAEYDSRNALFCGTAFNMFEHLDKFALVILLRVDRRTMEERLRDPRRDNVFGKVGDSAIWSEWWRGEVERELAERGAFVVDACRPLTQVVDKVLGVCAAAGMPMSGRV